MNKLFKISLTVSIFLFTFILFSTQIANIQLETKANNYLIGDVDLDGDRDLDDVIKLLRHVSKSQLLPDYPPVNLQALGINPSAVSIKEGETLRLSVTKLPENSDETITWSSADETVATVDQNGNVTGIKAGSTTIIHIRSSRTGLSATCVVTVTQNTIKATGVKLDRNSFFVYIGETTSWKITPTVTPANTTEKGTWTSSDPSLVTIDSNGNAKVVSTSLSSGITLETVTLTYNIGSVSASAIVTLSKKSDATIATNITLNYTKTSIEIGSYVNLKATLIPATANENIVWSSSVPEVATVDQGGRVTGVAMGDTIITATTASGKTASCQVTVTAVTVKNVAVYVSLSTTGDLVASKTYTAALKFSPALSEADMADFLYAIDSDSPNIVSVTNDYTTNNFTLIVGDDGSATLTPYVYTDKDNIQFTFIPLTVTVNSPSVNIKNPITAISLTVASGSSTLYVGDTMGLAVQVVPADHDDVCSWSTSDPNVAIVDEGVVTAVGVGTAKITYKAKGNLSKNGVSKSITVTVKSVGDIDTTLNRIIIAQGSTLKATMNSTVSSLESWVAGNGCLVSVTTDGYISCPAEAPVGNGGQVNCYYVDANNQELIKTFNVIIVRAVTTSNTAYAKYTFSTKDSVAYDITALGIDPFGKTFEAAGSAVNCTYDVSASGCVTLILNNKSKAGTASIYVKENGKVVARLDIIVTAKTYSITVNKSSTTGVSIRSAISDLSNANITSVSISNNDLIQAVSGVGDFYIKSKNGLVGTTTAVVSYMEGALSKQITVTIVVQ